jgi:hypothetical protein
VKIEGKRWRFSIAANASPEERGEAAHVICRHLVDPPRPLAERKRVVVLAALNLYEGSPYNRAKQLERNYATYLSNGWLREELLEELPDPRSTERALLHRLAKLSGGASLGWRQIVRIAA